jgi:hypothetical protein
VNIEIIWESINYKEAVKIKYEEFFVTDGQGNLLGYFDHYDKALAALVRYISKPIMQNVARLDRSYTVILN